MADAQWHPKPGKWHRDFFAEAVWTSTLSPNAKLLALAYADHANSGNVAYVANDRAGQRTGLSRSTVIRMRSELIRHGWLIEWAPATQHKATRYLLVIQGCQGDTPEPVDNSDQGYQVDTPDDATTDPGVSTGTPGVSNGAPRGVTVTPDAVRDLSNKDLSYVSVAVPADPRGGSSVTADASTPRRPRSRPSIRGDDRNAGAALRSLPLTWTWNVTHIKSMELLGLDENGQHQLWRAFCSAAQGQRRRDWDKAAGAFIRDWATGISGNTFPGSTYGDTESSYA